MLYVGAWKLNLLLADRYSCGRVFLAGDAVASRHPDRRAGHEHRRRRCRRSGVEAGRRRCGAGAGRISSRRTRSSGGRSATATSAPPATPGSAGANGGRSIGRTSATPTPEGRPRATTLRALPQVEQREEQRDDRRRTGLPLCRLPDHLARSRAGRSISSANTCRRPGRARVCRTSGQAKGQRRSGPHRRWLYAAASGRNARPTPLALERAMRAIRAPFDTLTRGRRRRA